MKVAVAVLLAIVLALVWGLTTEMVTNRQQRSQITELTSKLSDSSTRENLELQERCTLQAEKAFKQLGYKDGGELQNGVETTYRSHYNAKLSKCFIGLESNTFVTRTNTLMGTKVKYLLDAYEKRAYGEYMWIPREGKKYWEVPPVLCRLSPLSADENFCKSDEEYTAFEARYME